MRDWIALLLVWLKSESLSMLRPVVTRSLPLAIVLSCAVVLVVVLAFPMRPGPAGTRLANAPVIAVERMVLSAVVAARQSIPALDPVRDPVIAVVPLPPVKRAMAPRHSKTALLARAQAHIGSNPTGWDRLWCANFMALIAPHLAKQLDNPNLAREWAKLPKAKPAPGVIVVLKRGRSRWAGHIGIVKEVKRNRIVVVSGNTFHKGRRAVGINSYPKHRVVAYVAPGAV